MRIYVAGPYSNDSARVVQANVNEAIRVGCALIKKGHNPYIPHLTHYVWLHPDGDFPKSKWYELDNGWLLLCDALFYISSSHGADAELELAKKCDVKIFYDLDEVPDITRRRKKC